MPLPRNPYIAGNPVGSTSAFIGRNDVLRAVLQVLRNPNQNAITLFGQRRIGKTSVLENLAARLPEEGKYHPVYFDLQDKAAWTVQKVLMVLSRTIAESLGIEPLNPKAGQHDFKKSWLPKALAQLPAETSLVLLFDEFDVLADPKSTQAVSGFFPYLRELLNLDMARLQFVFVLGRNLSDLNQLALSLFKGVPDKRVSLLTEADTYKLVRLSEKNNTLKWGESALQRIYTLTKGHPFLTQALASQIWENAYEDEPEDIPEISPEMVDATIPATLEASRNTLRWLWDGLGPAEKVVASALAQAGNRTVTQVDLEQILRESGVRILIRELQNAPELLQDWDILEKAEGGYRFKVELLRQWIVEHKPLSRVQEELDYIQPVAENMFQAAKGLYGAGKLDDAESQLKQSLGLNPNHLRANELLAEILISQDRLEEAKKLLENLLDIAPTMARPRLIQIYLKQAENLSSEGEKLALFEKVLALDSRNTEALVAKRSILQKRGLEDVNRLEEEKEFGKALKIAQEMGATFSENGEWEKIINRLSKKTNLANSYQQALGALEAEDRETATKLLIDIINLEPAYENATEKLHLAVKNENIEELRELLERGKKEWGNTDSYNKDLMRRNSELEAKYTREKEKCDNLTGDVLSLGQKVEELQKQEKKQKRITAIGLTIGLLLGAIIIWAGLQRIKSPTETEITSTVSVDIPPTLMPSFETMVREKDGAIMSYIPAGEFMMGSENGDPDEMPVHKVYLDDFWMDQTEVTNAMYALCVKAGNCDLPSSTGNYENPEYAQHPVVYVSWNDAKNYCEWAGASLPTEAEWEKAARGGLEGKEYPWGDNAPICVAGADNGAQYNSCDGQTVSVKNFSANSYALYDMAGNVWEWTADWYNSSYYENSPTNNPLGPETGTYRVLRGGSWGNNNGNLRVASRGLSYPVNSNFNIGFRCLLSLP